MKTEGPGGRGAELVRLATIFDLTLDFNCAFYPEDLRACDKSYSNVSLICRWRWEDAGRTDGRTEDNVLSLCVLRLATFFGLPLDPNEALYPEDLLTAVEIHSQFRSHSWSQHNDSGQQQMSDVLERVVSHTSLNLSSS